MNWPDERSIDEAQTPEPARSYRPPAEETPVEDDEESIDLGRFLVALLSYKWLIIVVVAVATAGAAYYASNEPRRYRATAEILLDPPQPEISPVEREAGGKGEINAAKESALLTSSELARKAVKRLNLADNPLFVGDDKTDGGALAAIKRQLAGALGNAPGQVVGAMTGDTQVAATTPDRVTPGQPPAPPTSVLAQRYLGGLSVNINTETGIMYVAYTSGDPEFAATAANTTAELYIARKKKARGRAIRNANAWLRERVNEARQDLLDSEQALEDLRQRKGLTESASNSLASKQLARLNDRLLKAETEASKLRTQYEQAQRLLEANASVDNMGKILESDLIKRLRVQRLDLTQKIAELKTRYREQHPKIQNAKSELENINRKIREEAKVITENIKFELEVLEDRIARLNDQIQKVEKKVEKLRKAEGQVRTLESEVQANRDLYRTLLQRLQETNLQEQMKPQPEASIINRAQTPGAPFYPNEKVFIAAALLGSSILACASAIGLEFLRRGVGSLSELRGTADVQPLGILPKEKPDRRKSFVTISRNVEASPFVDALRRLRQLLLLREQGEPLPCLLVTSPWSGDGKTTTAHSLAALTTTMGNSCLVIECHRGEGHEVLRGPQETGWIQHLEDGKPLERIIETHDTGGFDMLPAGRTTERAYDLQASKAFADLITELKTSYDTIVVDAPAILDDMRLFAHPNVYDYVLLLVRANTTPKNALTYAVRRVAEVGIGEFGAVLNMVDMRDYERRESGEYRAALDRPGRKLPKQKSGGLTSLSSLSSVAAKLLPLAGGIMAVLGVAAMLAERLIALPPE
jgi:uncharacterized protein involved in exopolysaccharide biosynthesis/Mrp family chromosome partitioning ATPase